MGFDLCQKVLRSQLPITPNEKLLLAMIADRIDHKGFCYPSFRRLEMESGLSRSSVIRGLNALSKIKILFVHRVVGSPNEYKIIEDLLDELCKKDQGVSQGHSPKSGKSSVTVTPPQCQTETPGSVTEKPEGYQVDTQINKPIKNPKKKKKKAKGEPIAEEHPMIFVDVGKPGEGKTAMQVLEENKTFPHDPSFDPFKSHEQAMISFGAISNHESSDFIYHSLYGLAILEGGQTYNVVTQNVPIELIKRVRTYLESRGLKTDYLHLQDQYLKLYKPKTPTPISYKIPLEFSGGAIKDAAESLHKLKMAMQIPVELLPGDLSKTEFVTKIAHPAKFPLKMTVIDNDGSLMVDGVKLIEGAHVHFDLGKKDEDWDQSVHGVYEVSTEEENVNVNQIEKIVNSGKTNLKPAKLTPISSWRDAVLEWRNENDVKGNLLDFTQKDAGMLNKVKKKYGVGFYMAMAHAVKNWKAYVTYANLNTGGKSKPQQPSISYFILNIENVKLFLNKKSDTKVKLNVPKKLKITKKVMKDSKTKQLLAAAKEKMDGA